MNQEEREQRNREAEAEQRRLDKFAAAALGGLLVHAPIFAPGQVDQYADLAWKLAKAMVERQP